MCNLVIKMEQKAKDMFYTTCKTLGVTPMRTVLIMIKKFANGEFDAMPIIKTYKEFYEDNKDCRTQRLLKYRIDGGQAFRIHQKRKKDDIKGKSKKKLIKKILAIDVPDKDVTSASLEFWKSR